MHLSANLSCIITIIITSMIMIITTIITTIITVMRRLARKVKCRMGDPHWAGGEQRFARDALLLRRRLQDAALEQTSYHMAMYPIWKQLKASKTKTSPNIKPKMHAAKYSSPRCHLLLGYITREKQDATWKDTFRCI